MRLRAALTLSVLFLALSAAPASAQWFVTPYAGVHFGGDAPDTKLNLGAGVGFLGGGVFGFEADFGYSPDFFDSDNDVDFDTTGNLATVMANLIVTAPPTVGFRPYATVGAGWIRTNVESVGDVFTSANDNFGFNAGGGFMAQFNDHVGIRGDIRYMRAFVDDEEDNEFDISVGDFDFWRTGLGVVFTF